MREIIFYRSRIDSYAVVLIVDIGSSNGDAGTISNIEAVCILPSFSVAGRIINRYATDCEGGDAVDANCLDRGVRDV